MENATQLDEECLHCSNIAGTSMTPCCEAATRDEEVIRYLPLLAANDFLEADI